MGEMIMTKISIIVPVYNVEKYLRVCLESLLSQTFPNIEIICIDDASSDHSGNILDEYAERDTRVKVFHLLENKGTLYARILGVEKSSGEYIMFVDSDDSLETMTCKELLEIAEKNDVDVVHFGTYVHAERNVSTELKNWIINFLLPYEGLIESNNLIENCFVKEQFDFNITNKIWKRKVCEQAFSMVEEVKLVASEDRYIFFLLMYYANNYFGTTKKYYHYNVGIGVTGGDILNLEQFEKRCSGALASRLVKSFLTKVKGEERFAKEEKEFANKIVWDCVDCWHNKLAETDYQEGFEILKKYFLTNELVNAFARVYFEQGDEILHRIGLYTGKRIAIFYRYLGYENMDKKVIQYVHILKQRGHQVWIYTDYDREKIIEMENDYSAEIIYLPESFKANWDQYELRCNAFYEQLKKNKIDVLLYASPTSHIYWLDTLLATLNDIVVVDLNDEIYLDEFGKKLREENKEKDKLIKKLNELKQQRDELNQKIDGMNEELNSPKRMLHLFLRSCKHHILRKLRK